MAIVRLRDYLLCEALGTTAPDWASYNATLDKPEVGDTRSGDGSFVIIYVESALWTASFKMLRCASDNELNSKYFPRAQMDRTQLKGWVSCI